MNTKWEIAVASEVRPWYVDEEDGETRYQDVLFVTATSPDGRVYAHRNLFKSGGNLAQAEADAALLATRIRLRRSWKGPVDSEYWVFWRAIYGSAHYQRHQARFEAETELLDRASDGVTTVEAFDSLPDEMKLALQG